MNPFMKIISSLFLYRLNVWDIIGRVAPLWGAEFSSLEQLHESTMTINSNEVRKLLSIYI